MTTNATAVADFAVNDFDDSQHKGWRKRYGGLILVVGFHLVLLWFVVSDFAKSDLKITKPADSVVIQEVAIPPTPVPPAPPPPVPPPPIPPPPAPPTPDPPPPPVQTALQVKPKTPVLQTPKTVSIATPDPVIEQNTSAPNVVAPSPSQVVAPASQILETDYVRKVQGMLNATKRYPTGRQASQERPQGKVRIVFVLNRSGALQSAKVQDSSNSNLLDDSALAGVRRATYPAFDADLWKGQETHEFLVDIEFVPPGSR